MERKMSAARARSVLGLAAPSSALNASVPLSGAARDAYEVGITTSIFKGHAPPADGWFAPAAHAVTLHRISGSLHRIAEAECNGSEAYNCRACRGDGHGCKACDGTGDGPRLRRLRASAIEIAEHYGLRAYFQGDPRGCSLYLIGPEILPTDRAALERDYRYPGDSDKPPLDALQARWIESNYNRGHAVVRLGR